MEQVGDPRPKLNEPLNDEELQALRQNPRLLNESSFQPQITKHVKLANSPPLPGTPNPRLAKIAKYRFSSTSSIFMNQENNVLTPGVADVLRCIATALHFNMSAQFQIKPEAPALQKCDIWSETTHPLGDGRTNLNTVPSIEDILFFLETVWDGQALSAESAVMCLAYIDRFVALTSITLHPSNWRRITLAAAILASKVWEDLAVWNADFLALFPCVKVSDLNRLEREMLMALEFVVGLKASIYAKYYFDLRALSEKSEMNFPLEPLSSEEGKKLEHKSQGLEDAERQERFKLQARSKSLDPTILTQYLTKEKG